MYKAISMYTINTPYEQEVKYLEESLNNFNIEHHSYPIQSTGIWSKNTQEKAKVLLQSMDDFPKYNIVWLDADAIVVQNPILFETLTCDFAAVMRPHRDKVRHRLLSGTMFMKNNDKMKDIINKWIALNGTNKLWDQENLWNIIEQNRSNIKIENLPEEYTKIKRPHNEAAGPSGVIWHNQRSREVRTGKWKI